MQRTCLFLICILILVFVCGCVNHDQMAFVKAQSENTEKAYLDYAAEFPEGEHVSEANDLAHKCAVNEAIAEYRRLEKDATAAEVSGDWPKAHEIWTQSNKALDISEDEETSSEYQTCKKESQANVERCRIVIENPIAISDKKVSGRYRYTDNDPDTAGTHWSSITLNAKATNNCAFFVSDIAIRLTMLSPTALTINTTTGEDVSRGGSTELAKIVRTIFIGTSIAPGASRRFSIKAPVSFDVGIMTATGNTLSFNASPDFPEYSVEVVSYKAR